MWWQVTVELLQQQRRKSCDTALLEMREPRSSNLIRLHRASRDTWPHAARYRSHKHKSVHQDIIEETSIDVLPL